MVPNFTGKKEETAVSQTQTPACSHTSDRAGRGANVAKMAWADIIDMVLYRIKQIWAQCGRRVGCVKASDSPVTCIFVSTAATAASS